MRIKSLIIYNADKNTLKEYSFSQGELGFTSTYLFGDTTKNEALTLLGGLKKIFTSETLSPGEQITVTLEDDTQCTWRIKKNGRNQEFYREGELIPEEHVQKSLLAAMLDLDIRYENPKAKKSAQLWATVIRSSRSHFVGKEYYEETPLSSMHESLEEHLLRVQHQAGNIIQAENKTLSELIEIASHIEEIQAAHQHAHSFEKSIISSLAIPPDQQLSATRILTELQLISNIEQLVRDLEERKEEIKAVKMRLNAINMDLEQFENNGFISHIYKDTPWREILNKYAELLATTQLIDAFSTIEKSFFQNINRATQGLSETFHEAETAINNTLSAFNEESEVLNDYKLFKERALSEIESRVSKEQNDALAKAMSALKAMVPGPSKSRAVLKRAQIEEDIFHTKDIWQRLEKCGGQLSSLQLYLRENSELGQVYLQPVKDHIEKLVTRMGAQKQDWQQIKSSYLSEDLPYENVEDLLVHIRQITSIVELECEKKQLQLDMAEFQVSATKLVKLIRDWRDLTRSMRKETPKELSLIIAEAKSIIRFKHEKENLLDKLNEYSAQAKLPELVVKQFDLVKKGVQQKWQAFLKKYDLPHMIYDESVLKPFLDACRELSGCRNVLKENLGMDVFFEPLKLEEKAPPILVYLNFEQNTPQLARESLKDFLLAQEPHHIQIVMLLGRENYQQFARTGFGIIQMSDKKLRATDSTKQIVGASQKPLTQNKKILSTKAEEALKVFGRKINL